MSLLPLQSTSYDIWQTKYQLKDNEGNPVDATIEETYKRVAKALASVEKEPDVWYPKFLDVLENGATPAGRILSNAGAGEFKPATSLINCTVSQIVEDSMPGIMEACKDSAITLAAGAGIGYEFSTLRPKGSYVGGAGSYTSGPLTFMSIFDTMCFTVSSAGGRRGAQMGTFAVWHPDVEAFIKAKREDGKYRQFNLSLLIDDDFMEAVKTDSDWDLIFPLMKKESRENNKTVWKTLFWDEEYCKKQGYIVENGKILCKVYNTIKAQDLWDTIMNSTYNFAEPGFLLIDKINKYNNNYFCERIRATNPCVTADTPILTDKGYLPIVETVGIPTNIWNGKEWSEVVPFSTGVNPLMRVLLSDGTHLDCTPYHKWVLSDGSRVETKDLQDGDKLGKFQMPTVVVGETYPIDAYSQGFYSGDGNTAMTRSWVYEPKYPVIERLIGKVYNSSDTARRVWNHGAMLEKNFVPINGSQEYCLNWLAGIIDSDGNVMRNPNSTALCINANDKKFLVDIRLMLSRLGVQAKVVDMGEAGYRTMPNGRGGQQDYFCEKTHRLLINAVDVKHLVALGIKFSRITFDDVNPNRDARRFVTVVDVTELPTCEETYCFAEPKNNTGTFNGIVTGQCGEQPLPPEGSCLLGSLNLASFVKNPFTKDSIFDTDSFIDTVRIFTRMLDNVVEMNGLPLEGQREAITNKRRHGMGFTGLGSALSMLGIAYGSQESIDFTDMVMREMAVAGFQEGIKLADEKGVAPIFKNQDNVIAWVNGAYMQRIWEVWPEGKQQAIQSGCRFTHHTSIAPTGTISLSVNNNVSNGIEPTFSHKYTRNVIKAGKKTKDAVSVYSYEMLLYKHITGEDEVPEFFSTSDNVSTKAHVDIQAAAQYWCDSSISKTINVPTDMPFSEFKDVYMYAYDKGLKGCTTFRFNPEAFQGVLVKDDDLKNTQYVFNLEDGTTVEVSGDTEIEYDGEMHKAANLYDAIKEGLYGKF